MSLLPSHGISEHLLRRSNSRASRAKTTPVVSNIWKLNLLVVANMRFSFSFVNILIKKKNATYDTQWAVNSHGK